MQTQESEESEDSNAQQFAASATVPLIKKQAGEQCDDKENLYDPEKIMAFPD